MSKIRILNPVPGTVGFATRRGADRWVRAGLAEWTRPGFIRFTCTGRQARNAAICVGTRVWASAPPEEHKALFDWRGRIPAWEGKIYYKPGEKVS